MSDDDTNSNDSSLEGVLGDEAHWIRLSAGEPEARTYVIPQMDVLMSIGCTMTEWVMSCSQFRHPQGPPPHFVAFHQLNPVTKCGISWFRDPLEYNEDRSPHFRFGLLRYEKLLDPAPFTTLNFERKCEYIHISDQRCGLGMFSRRRWIDVVREGMNRQLTPMEQVCYNYYYNVHNKVVMEHHWDGQPQFGESDYEDGMNFINNTYRPTYGDMFEDDVEFGEGESAVKRVEATQELRDATMDKIDAMKEELCDGPYTLLCDLLMTVKLVEKNDNNE